MKYAVTNVGYGEVPRQDKAHLVIEVDGTLAEMTRILNAARKAEQEIEQENSDRVTALWRQSLGRQFVSKT